MTVSCYNMYPLWALYTCDRTSECSASGREDSDWSNSSDEDSEALYHKRYIFTKKMAKSIIYVCIILPNCSSSDFISTPYRRMWHWLSS